MGVSIMTVRALRDSGHSAVHLRELGRQTLPDDEILALAVQQSQTVLTFDLDFGDLLAASGRQTPSVILFRMRNQTPQSLTPRLLEILRECTYALEAGALILVEDYGYRVRRLPILNRPNSPPPR